MRLFKREGVQPLTANEAIKETYRGPELQQLFVSLIGGKPPSRRDDAAAALLNLLDHDRLEASVGKLSDRERGMVAEAAWSENGFFNRSRFDAREKAAIDAQAPVGDDDDDDAIGEGLAVTSRERTRTWIDLILPQGVLARDLQQRIRSLLPKPAVPAVDSVDAPPATVTMPVNRWNAETKSYEKIFESVPVEVREMSRAAQHELAAVLRLVDAGKIPVTEKNHTPKPSAVAAITAVLDGGDYYPEAQEPAKAGDGFEYEKAGPIRALAWPMLLLAGKLARVRASKLELTPAGKAALLASPAGVLRDLWDKWVESDQLDELRRIDVIRGQTGKGHRYLTAPAGRREKVAAALRECPVGRWVAVDEFSRHMRAAGHEFQVTSDAWSLYIGELQYGSLGYDGFGGWNILQLRYLLCLLMEYAATVGMVDIALMPPEGARSDYRQLWGADDLPFFSRYDGLLHLRVTKLGAYILGLEEAFQPQEPADRHWITVGDDLTITADAPLSTGDVMLLETFAEQAGPGEWRLDRDKILDAEAAGRNVRELIAFLESASGDDLPEPVAEFFDDVDHRTNALQDAGAARLVRCADESLARFIAGHPETAKFCWQAGPDRLVIADKHRSAFDRGLKKLGFIVRRAS